MGQKSTELNELRLEQTAQRTQRTAFPKRFRRARSSLIRLHPMEAPPHVSLSADDAKELLEDFLRAPPPINLRLTFPWTGKGCSKKQFPLLDWAALEGDRYVIVVRGNRNTLSRRYPRSYRVSCRHSSQRALLKEHGLTRSMWCCNHLPFTLAFWAITTSSPEYQLPARDVLLFEWIPQRYQRDPPEQLVAPAALLDAPMELKDVPFAEAIARNDVATIRRALTTYGVHRVVQVDLHRYGFSLGHEAVRSDKPEIFIVLIEIEIVPGFRPFVSRGKRDNNSSVLHQALYQGRAAMAKRLCEVGAPRKNAM